MPTKQIIINTRGEVMALVQVCALLPSHPALVIDELISYTLTAFSYRDEFSIDRSASRLLSYCKGGDPDIVERFLKIWGKFCLTLLRIFEHLQLWDDRGVHHYYYHWHDDFDLILRHLND